MKVQTEGIAMKPSTPKAELPPSRQPRKPAFGGSPRKRLLALVAVLGLVAWGSGVANAQLINGTMDAVSVSSQVLPTPTSWTVVSTLPGTPGFNDGASSEPWNNVADPGGFGVFVKTFFGDVVGPKLTVHLYQDTVGTPGITYTLTGWVGSGPGYSGEAPGSGTLTQFGLEFLDAGSSVIGGSVLSLGPAQLTLVNGNPFDYASYTVMATAPAGTVSVRSRFSMIDGYDVPGAGDAALVTDFYTLVPEPSTFALAGLGLLAGLVRYRRRS